MVNRVRQAFLALTLVSCSALGINAVRAQASPLGWDCTLSLKAAYGERNYCTLGVAPGASDGEDDYDWPGFLLNPDAFIAFEPAFQPGAMYWYERRAPFLEGETKTWSVRAYGYNPGPLTLSWQFYESPEDFEFTLFFEGSVPDPTAGTPIPMIPGDSFTWTQGPGGFEGPVFLRVEVSNPQRSATLPDCTPRFDPPNPIACEPVMFSIADPDQDIAQVWWSMCSVEPSYYHCWYNCAIAEGVSITRQMPEGTDSVICAVANTEGDYTICQSEITVANAPPTMKVGFGRLGRLSEPPMTWLGEPLAVSVRAEDPCCGRVETISIDWGDGSSQTVRTGGSHTYESLGTYLVTVTATDDGGATTSESAEVTVYPEGAGCSVVVNPPQPRLGELFTLTVVPTEGEAIACQWARAVYGVPVGGCRQGPFVLHPIVRDHPERGWPVVDYWYWDNSLHYSVRTLDSTGGLSECSGAIPLPWRDVGIAEVRDIKPRHSHRRLLLVKVVSHSEVPDRVKLTVRPDFWEPDWVIERTLTLQPGQRRWVPLSTPVGCAIVEASLLDAYDLAWEDNQWWSPECSPWGP